MLMCNAFVSLYDIYWAKDFADIFHNHARGFHDPGCYLVYFHVLVSTLLRTKKAVSDQLKL
jgi:hypothetical protein